MLNQMLILRDRSISLSNNLVIIFAAIKKGSYLRYITAYDVCEWMKMVKKKKIVPFFSLLSIRIVNFRKR